ncbi:MAG: hypothetical protein LAC70_07255 [Methylovulum sp.]|nr:hypothetical protein [Methylovulum sp.]
MAELTYGLVSSLAFAAHAATWQRLAAFSINALIPATAHYDFKRSCILFF